MTTIDVDPADGAGTRFSVEVGDDDGSRTGHQVIVSDAEWERFGAGYGSRSALVEASFRFLLEREPKGSILRSFELGVIERYFPEYRAAITPGADG
jgi:hypothetical protein